MVRIESVEGSVWLRSPLSGMTSLPLGVESPDQLMDLIGRSYEINALADPHTNLDIASSIHSKPCPVPGCIADGKKIMEV